MILGNPKKIDLSISVFERLRTKNCLYIDKTKFIEHFLNSPNDVQLILRQRRLGKSLNIDMLRCFLTDIKDNKYLFAGTYIENSPLFAKINSAPVFCFDFKNLNAKDYKLRIAEQIDKQLSFYVDAGNLKGYLKRRYDNFINNMETTDGSYTEGLLVLTELVYETTGKRSYILIDEYDRLLIDYQDTENYSEIRDYETRFLSAGLKGNPYLEKAILTGVLRVSRESILSGLNNLQTYDIFTDDIYTADFGLIDSEIDELQQHFIFNKSEVKDWYNGVKINSQEIYNIYSVLSYLQKNTFDNYWGRSGTIQTIVNLLDEVKKTALLKMLGGETIEVYISRRISLNDLNQSQDDGIFYSLLVQAGYLALEQLNHSSFAFVRIPNKELMNVWKEFILSNIVQNATKLKTLFDNINCLAVYDKDIAYFLNDKLSYFDITENENPPSERIYHVFVLGLLSSYEDITYKKPPLSNRESGDGRYDILFEKSDFCIIFEFKSVANAKQLEAAAENGLRQIDEKRYYADAPKDKPLIKTAIAFCGKRCIAKSTRHGNY